MNKEGNMSTLEGWASPTTLTKYADHTFVYCPDNNEIFGCWDGGDIKAPDAVKICAGTYDNAYAVANCYRDSHPPRPDTAGVGVYGLNGVCHQSANCFLYAAGTQLVLKGGRPGGLLESTAAYGAYGAAYPFDSADILHRGPAAHAAHWAAWYTANYWWCSGKKDNVKAISKDPIFRETHGLYERLRSQSQAPNGAAAAKISDLTILIEHAVPGLDLGAIADLQYSYLKEHEGFLRAELPSIPKIKVIDEKSAERVNALSAQFQKALAQRVGADNYMKLTGRGTSETIDLLDSRILEGAWRAASQG